ncbi:MAG: alpha/beta hydrolase [Salinivirgaceae bacterium]
MKLRCLLLFLIVLVGLVSQLEAQKRHPVTNQLIPIPNYGNSVFEDGTFYGYEAKFGIINHSENESGLQFVLLESLETNPWLVILNGGPGRTNMRLPFEIDSLLKTFNLLLPGYRGIDDGAYKKLGGKSDSTIEAFIHQNRKYYSTQKLVDDVMLICEQVHIDSFYIAAHSYGTIVAKKLYKSDELSVNGMFEFSPVMETAPVPNPDFLQSITNHVADSINVNLTEIEDTLRLWMQSPRQHNLAMGLIASFYIYDNAVSFFRQVSSGALTRSDVATKGSDFLQIGWLLDYGMKFNRMADIDRNGADIYQKISHLFYSSVSKYLPSDAPVIEKNTVCNAYRPYCVSFIPKHEIFYMHSGKPALTVLCECGHADLWEKAPQYILEYYNLINP